MTEISADDLTDLTHLAEERWAAAHARDRRFWAWVAAAAFAHALVLIGFGGADPRRLGDASGSDNAISVSLVTEAELNSRSTVPETGGVAPSVPAAAAPQQKAPPPKPPEPKQEDPKQADPEQAAKVEPQPEPRPEAKVELQDAIKPSVADDVPAEVLKFPEPGPSPDKPQPAEKSVTEKPQVEPKPQPPAKPPQKKTAKLDLTPPPMNFNSPATGGGGSAGFERPPGITRSGANDDFARGVIRALQQTMPQLRDTRGRVTVRIVLNTNGDVANVQVVRSANNASLDQSVVFATKQTSYPLPPHNSNDADRTFLVTYIYR